MEIVHCVIFFLIVKSGNVAFEKGNMLIFNYITEVRLSGMNLVCVCTPSSYRGVNLAHGSMHNYAC